MIKQQHVSSWLIVLILCLLSLFQARATHIRAGEIVAVRISQASLTYRFTVIGYSDTGSSVVFGGGEIDFGDGTVLNLSEAADDGQTNHLQDEVAYNFLDITHTFVAPGRYTIRYNERNRNAGVQNMSNSVDTPFYIETTILIDPYTGPNNTPVFLVPPVDRGSVGMTFLHNPGAYDEEGDSLSFRLTVPKQSFDQEVNDYLSPAHGSFYDKFREGNEDGDGQPVFEIDPITGLLKWDAPGTPGEYNVAFIVDEWRNIEGTWYLVSSMTRDIQIIIEDSDNLRPQITPPDNICAETGQSLDVEISATDPDQNQLKIEAFGGPFEQVNNSAVMVPDQSIFQESPASASFTWQTSEEHIRTKPYYIVIKASDYPEFGPSLVDFNFFTVQLTSSSPLALSLDDPSSDNNLSMSWETYESDRLDKMAIWRRVGSEAFDNSSCEFLALDSQGYTQIDEVENSTEYDDSNVKAGARHCYRVQAIGELKAYGRSLPSDEACFIADAIAAIPVKVDVASTDDEVGKVQLSWLKPFDIDEAAHAEPYSYQIFRGDSNDNLTLIDTTSDLDFTDNDVNSTEQQFYRIDTYDSSDKLINKSSVASTVSLTTKTTGLSVQLDWTMESPWSTVDAKHKIYRNNVEESSPSKFVHIASVDSRTGTTYTDYDVVPDVNYRYYVKVFGDYHNPDVEYSIRNKSQITSGKAVVATVEAAESQEIVVYPNPFQRLVNVKGGKSRYEMTLLNSSGQIIIRNIKSETIDLSGLKSGSYFLRFQTGKMIRLIKE